MKIVIDMAEIPVRDLIKYRGELLQMLEDFSAKHPEISIPGSAVRVEGTIFGADFSRNLF